MLCQQIQVWQTQRAIWMKRKKGLTLTSLVQRGPGQDALEPLAEKQGGIFKTRYGCQIPPYKPWIHPSLKLISVRKSFFYDNRSPFYFGVYLSTNTVYSSNQFSNSVTAIPRHLSLVKHYPGLLEGRAMSICGNLMPRGEPIRTLQSQQAFCTVIGPDTDAPGLSCCPCSCLKPGGHESSHCKSQSN